MKKKTKTAVMSSHKDPLLVALDIGSSKLRLIAGYVGQDKQIKIKGYQEIDSRGYQNGAISDIDLLASQIAKLIMKFRADFDIPVTKIITGVPGHAIIAENQHGTATVQTGVISLDDRNTAITNAIAGIKSFSEQDWMIIHSNPQNYSIESSELVTNPIGMYAKRIDVNVHVIGCNLMYKKNMDIAIKKTSSDIDDDIRTIYVGNAASSAVLTDAEKDNGVIHVDIGGGTLSVTVYESNRQLLSFGVPDGGDYITKEISRKFAIPKSESENLKCNYGVASAMLLSEEQANEDLILSISEPYPQEIRIKAGELAAVINGSLNNMIVMLLDRVLMMGKANFKKLTIGSGIVLTGGTAKLAGIDYVVSNIISNWSRNPANSFLECNDKVRVGRPGGISLYEGAGDPAMISETDKAVAVGLLRSARFEDLGQYKHEPDDPESLWGKIKKWIKQEM
ncbi:MAG: cell division protein FtsA [Succinivibrio sp.]